MNKSGIILIVLGCLFLANNFDLLAWSWLKQWWPLALIAIGVWSVIDHRSGERRAPRDTDRKP